MNSFQQFSVSLLFFVLFLHTLVVCRISDKRKCADADCSKPVSYATTLLIYNADDDRLLSFPPNVKLKVFSKEAGDNPTFWEVEIDGKRGYVPKDFLRENKVLIPSSKLTHIVPTGRIESSKTNTTSENAIEKEANSINLMSATPELSVANSKGLFSTISGVSADSVPMNSPDIKPQSTRKFQVFEGTTLYDDVVSEKPESPPTVIDETVKENEENDQKLDSVSVPQDDSSMPSLDVKPVNEDINENKQVVGAEDKIGEVVETKEKVDDLRKTNDGISNQHEEGTGESSSEPTLLNSFVNRVTKFMSSGAGEDESEEDLEYDEDEDDEGSVEEEDNEVEAKEKRKADIEDESTAAVENREQLQPEIRSVESSSNAFDVNNTLEEGYSDLEQNDSQRLEYDNSSLELNNEHTDREEIKNLTEESLDSREDSKGSDGNIQVNEFENTSKTEEYEKLSLKEEEIYVSQPSEGKTSSYDSFEKRKETSQDIRKIEDREKLAEESAEAEKTITSTENNLVESPEYQVTPDLKKEIAVDEIQNDTLQSNDIEKEPQTQDQDQPKIDDPREKEEESQKYQSQAQKSETDDESQFQEQPMTDESKIHEELVKISEEPQIDGPQSLDSETTTQEAPEGSQPEARQFLYDSREFQGDSAEEKKYENTDTTLQTPDSHNVSSEIESPSENSQVNLTSPHPIYSSLSNLQSVASPKYTSVVSRRIQSSGLSPVSEVSSNFENSGEEDESEDEENIISTSESTPVPEETLSPYLLRQSQSPKYNQIVRNHLGPLSGNTESETLLETTTEAKADSDQAEVTTQSEFSDASTVEIQNLTEEKVSEEEKPKEEIIQESLEVPAQDPQESTYADDPSRVGMVDELPEETSPEEGMLSLVSSIFDVFGSKSPDSTEELPAISESFESSQTTHISEESCSAGGGEGSCPMLAADASQQEVTWQQTTSAADMWELLDRVPLEATLWLIITAVVVLIFSLGHYYIEAHRRDGPLVAIINKLEREVLILKKEKCIMEDRLNIAEQQLEGWNTSSSENDALIVEMKQELDETRVAKAELEEQVAQLKDELDTVTESGLEMHRLLEESLSSQDGSQVLLSTVETLREKLQRQEEEISGLSDTLSSKNAEVEELMGRLAHSAEVARNLEDRVIAVTREKDEELLRLREKHRELVSQMEDVMETKALEETRLSTEMSKLRLTIEEMQKTLAEKDSELDTLKEVVKQLRATDSNEKMEALFDVVGVQAKLKTAVAERDEFREKFMEEEGARKLLEGHMKKITQEVVELKNSFETAEKEKIEALTKLQVLSNYFKEKESQLQKELGLQESMWLQKQSDDHTIYEQMRSLREENEKYKLQNESLKKEIVEQESSFKIQLANTEQKAHENWVASRQAERRLKEAQQESAQLRNRLTTVEKNSANYSLDEKPNISESNGDPSSPPPSLMFPPTTSPPFMMYGPPIPPPGDFVPPPPLMGSPYPSDSRPPPLGRISSPPLDHRFSPPPPLPYPPYDYSPYGHHSPSPPPPLPAHHRNVHKPQPREMSREQKEHVPNYTPEGEKAMRRSKR